MEPPNGLTVRDLVINMRVYLYFLFVMRND